MAAAAELFLESGFANTSMTDIARRTGLSKGLVYFYFKNKEDLYLAVLQHALTINLNFLRSTFDELEAEDGLTRALSILDRFLLLSMATASFQEIIIHSMQLTESDHDPAVARKMGVSEDIWSNARLEDIRRKQLEIYDVVKMAITDGQGDGSIRNNSAPGLIYLSIWSFIIGFETMMPVLKHNEKRQAGPVQEYLKVNVEEWKAGILQFCRQILLTEG